jgi:hypothetical protein
MISPPSKASGRIPGGPPGDFQEWDGNHGVRGNGKAREANDSQMENYISLPSIYGSSDLPLFGPQYGSSSLSRRQQGGGPIRGPRTQVGTMCSEGPQPLGLTSQNPALNHQGPSLSGPDYSKRDIGITFRYANKTVSPGIILTCSEIRDENHMRLSQHHETCLSDRRAPMKQYHLPHNLLLKVHLQQAASFAPKISRRLKDNHGGFRPVAFIIPQSVMTALKSASKLTSIARYGTRSSAQNVKSHLSMMISGDSQILIHLPGISLDSQFPILEC